MDACVAYDPRTRCACLTTCMLLAVAEWCEVRTLGMCVRMLGGATRESRLSLVPALVVRDERVQLCVRVLYSDVRLSIS